MVCTADRFAMVELDVRLVRLATRHFNDLQGYRTALVGSVLVAVSSVSMATHSGTASVFSSLCAFLLVIYPMRQVDRYYADRFGRVEQGDKAYLGLVLLCVMGGLLLDSRQPFGPLAFWLLWSAYPMWLLFDGWPYRNHQVVEVAAALCAGAIGWTGSGAGDGVWSLAPGLLLVGFASIVTGLADHVLLLKATRAADAGASRRQHQARG
jgi:hypothetical protein